VRRLRLLARLGVPEELGGHDLLPIGLPLGQEEAALQQAALVTSPSEGLEEEAHLHHVPPERGAALHVEAGEEQEVEMMATPLIYYETLFLVSESLSMTVSRKISGSGVVVNSKSPRVHGDDSAP